MEYFFPVENYSLSKTLLSGQAFRWNKSKDGYIGVISDSVVILSDDRAGIKADVIAGNISKEYLARYLSLDDDYLDIINKVPTDPWLQKSLEKYLGYRILTQDKFETLISFICSTNSNIQNTRTKVKNLSKMYGRKIFKDFYTFPNPEDLMELSESEIMKAKVGYRGKFIINTSKLVKSKEYLNNLEEMNDIQAINKLIELPGVGYKVADCVLLFAFHRLNRTPVDVWMKKILFQLYGIKQSYNYKRMEEFCENMFGKYSGYYSHFMFENARSGNLLSKQ